jgi:hypothetical protein
VEDCKYGIELNGSGSPVVRADANEVVEIDGCTTGLYVYESCTPDVDDVTITSPSGGTGLWTAGTSGGTYTDVSISGGSYGFKGLSTTSHKFRSGSITGFSNYGVYAVGSTEPNLGQSGDNGNNSIYSASCIYYVWVKYRPVGNVMAEMNWWGTWPPPAGKFYGAVDYNPYRTTVPPASAHQFAVAEVPQDLRLRFSPNPMSGGGEVWLSIPPGAEYYEVEIIDIQGRLVRTLVSRTPAATGPLVLPWDGRDDRGRDTSSGAYFVRVRTDRESRVTKVLRLQ